MPGDTPEESSSQPARERRHSGRIPDWIDAIAKVAVPIVVAGATWVGVHYANKFQGQMSGATLLSEREKAESQLRASMFGSLIEPIIGSPRGGLIPLDREQLLVELLALNFHEHFEMKPLFQRVDARLAVMRDKGAQERREALRSITRRIIDRQIAMFQKKEDGGGSDRQKARVYSLTLVENPKKQDTNQRKFFRMLTMERDGRKGAYQVDDPINGLATPDERHKFTMVISKADWDKQEFTVDAYDEVSPVSNGPNANQARTTRYPIRLTWFNFPLTDNTLFPDGNRFSVVLYDVRGRDQDPLRNMMLKFIVFPRNYFTPRERPFDQDEFLRLVGKERD